MSPSIKLSRNTLALYFEYRDELKDYDRYVLQGKFSVLDRALEELLERTRYDPEGHVYKSDDDARESIAVTFDEWFEVYMMLDSLYLPLVDANYDFTEVDYEHIFSEGIFNNDTDGAAEYLCVLGSILDIP